MALTSSISVEKEDAAIDMNISMAAEALSELLHIPVDEALTQFLQSETCRILYDRESKLWWEGPSAIVEYYLEETGQSDMLQRGMSLFAKPTCSTGEYLP